MTDLELVKRALTGQPGAQEALARRLDCVARFLSARNHRLGSPFGREELEDLAQDTMIGVWRTLPRFEGRAKLETWVWRVCWFHFANALRESRPDAVARATDLEGDDPALTAVDDQDHGLSLGDLDRMLEQLPARESEVVRRRILLDQSVAAIADDLDVAGSTVKTHYQRALAKLRLWLRPEDLGGHSS